jgi:hypothetical protein
VLIGLAILGCGVWVALAFRAGRIPALPPWPVTERRFRLRFRPGRVALMLIGLTLVAWAAWVGRTIPAEAPTAAIGLGWAAGVTLGAFGLVGTAIPPETSTASSDDAGWLIGLTVIALLVRVVALDRLPADLSIDEAELLNMARLVRFNSDTSPFATGWYQHPYGLAVLQAVSVRLLGDTLTAARLPSAILGALHVPALYLVARRLFTNRVALWSAALLAVLPVHILFSRSALNQPGDTLFTLLAVLACLRAWRSGQPGDYVLLGIALGMAQFFYAAGLFNLLMLLVWIVVVAVRKPLLIYRQADAFLLTAGAFVLVTLPYYGYLLHNGLPLLARADVYITAADAHNGVSVYLNALAASPAKFAEFVGQAVRDAYLAYISVPDRGLYRLTRLPLLGLAGVIPFLIGLLIALRRGRDPRYALPALFVLALPLVTLLAQPVPNYFRYVGVLPFAALLAGIGVCAMIDVLQPTRRVWIIGLAALVLALDWGAHGLLARCEPIPREVLPQVIYNAIGREIAAEPPDHPLIFLWETGRSPHYSSIVAVYTDLQHVIRSHTVAALADLPSVPCEAPMVLFTNDLPPEVEADVQALYPGGIWQRRFGGNDGDTLLYARYDVYSCSDRLPVE